MSDINHITTLGIGTPAGIPEFLLFGLQIGADTFTNPHCFHPVLEETRHFGVGEETRHFGVKDNC